MLAFKIKKKIIPQKSKIKLKIFLQGTGTYNNTMKIVTIYLSKLVPFLEHIKLLSAVEGASWAHCLVVRTDTMYYHQAMKEPDAKKFLEAMDKEIQNQCTNLHIQGFL